MAIIGVSSPNRYVGVMAGERLTLQHFCPSCGRPMGLVRIIPASPGYRELQTYGCRDCGVWITEGDSGENSRKGISVRK